MQIRLTGEQPFQVLSTTFTIGPSVDGYDLMFSADGVNYSKLFTVGANTNRQVTQVAAGSYYYLSGNTGNVVVNWFGNCVVDNGGGGGTQYTAGNGIQISGSDISVKAGEGLAFSGDTLIATGGGGTPADYDAVKGQVSANTQNIETLSAVTSGLTEAVAGKQDTLSAGNGIDLSGNTISVKIGDGLAFSGDTLVVSGETGGSNDYYVGWDDLYDMDYAPRRAVFNELVDKYNAGYHIYASGTTAASNGFDVILPLVEFTPGTWSTDRYNGGWAKFGGIHQSGDTRGYFYASLGSTGNITPSSKYFSKSDFYTLPTAATNTKGGVKVGSGLTMSGETMSVNIGDGLAYSGNTIVVSGGSGEQNYVIAGALSAVTNPVEGIKVFVPQHVTQTFTGTKIYISDFEHFTENTDNRAESFLARIHWGDWDSSTMGVEDLLAAQVYQSGNEFYWDWENGGKMHTREFERNGNYYTIMYKCVNGNDTNGSEAYFELYPVDTTPYGNYIIALSDYVSTAETTYSVVEPETEYTYKSVGSGETWVKQQNSHYLNIGDPDNPVASVAERVAFYNAIVENPGDNWYMDINNEGLKRFEYFYTSNDGKPIFTADYGGGIRKGYALNADGSLEYYHDDRPNVPQQEYIGVDSGGTLHTDVLGNLTSEQPYKMWMRYDSPSSLNSELTDSSYAPIKYLYRRYEEISDETKLVYYLCAEIMIGGTLYKGTWHFIEWEWGDQPIAADTWTAI